MDSIGTTHCITTTRAVVLGSKRSGAPDTGDPEDVPAAPDLFDPSTTARVLVMQCVVPILSTAGAYLAFRMLGVFGVR